jgi:hypothetical protein
MFSARSRAIVVVVCYNPLLEHLILLAIPCDWDLAHEEQINTLASPILPQNVFPFLPSQPVF